jgi:hypothetical protein
MKKWIISAGLLCHLLSAKAQDSLTVGKVLFEEANFVSSYYSQDGNKSAVTGGIGSEKLSDIGGSLNVSFSLLDKKLRKNIFFVEGAIEKYTSASSDQIDPTTLSSASRTDVHIYPSAAWTRKNEKTGNTIGVNVAYSTEFDYKSYGAGLLYAKTSPDKNSEFSAKLNVFFDQWKVILPAELRPDGYPTGSEEDSEGIPYKPRNSYNASFSYSKIVNPVFQWMILIDPSFQEGLLSTPFHRVYFSDETLKVERLPGTRLKLPVGLRGSYFLGDRSILRAYYRYYVDNWGLQAHTLQVEPVYKITPFISLSPHFRLNAQKGMRYFGSYMEQNPGAEYYSSDTDLSSFTSHLLGLGLRLAPPGGIMGITNWKSIDLRYGFYSRNTNLQAHILSLSVQFR